MANSSISLKRTPGPVATLISQEKLTALFIQLKHWLEAAFVED